MESKSSRADRESGKNGFERTAAETVHEHTRLGLFDRKLRSSSSATSRTISAVNAIAKLSDSRDTTKNAIAGRHAAPAESFSMSCRIYWPRFALTGVVWE
jgi:hypothetical protein